MAGVVGSGAVTAGSFEYTATGSKDAGSTVGTSPLTQTAQGTFVEVDLTIKNVGTSSAAFLSNHVKVVDAAGKTSDADPTATLYANPDQSAWVAAIDPGNAISGRRTGIEPFVALVRRLRASRVRVERAPYRLRRNAETTSVSVTATTAPATRIVATGLRS